MKKKLLCLLTVSLLLVMTGCTKTPKLQDGKEVVAEVNGKQFTAEDLYAKLKSAGGTGVIVDMVDAYITSQEIKDNTDAETYADVQLQQIKLQYTNSGEDFNLALLNAGYKTEQDFRDTLITSYNKNKVAENYYRDNLTDKDIQKFYDDEIIGKITARHILIKPETKEDMTSDQKKEAEQKALEKAKELIKKLNEGADFATLAKENSADGSASEGGLLNPFDKQSSYVSEFLDAAVKLEVGKYSTEPVKSQYGYHIILKEKQDEKPSLEETKDTIIDALVKEKMSASENAEAIAWAEVRKKYNLNIFDTDIKDNYDSVIKNLK